MTAPLAPWSPTRPLDVGTTLIEASAGTGKTWNITSLVTRLVAEVGVPIARILVVTYTRAATAELKDRLRERLLEALGALESARVPDDPVLAHLHADASARPLRSRRLRDALESFDQALVSTIHGFCQRMLQQNAFESRAAFDLELAADAGDLVEELVDDHLVRVYYDAGAELAAFYRSVCRFTRDDLKKLAELALADPDTAVVPAPDSASVAAWAPLVDALRRDWAGLGASFVAYVAGQVADAKAGRPSILTKGQRKQSEAEARAWVDGVTGWLARSPAFPELPPEPDRWDLDGVAKQLADPDVGFEHEALDRLAEVVALPDRVASALRSGFVHQVRAAFEAGKARRRVQTFQDLLRGLSHRLDPAGDPDERAALARAIGDSFDAALIDEFQDTDHHQWTIFREVFGGGRHHLYLIGDPKQAIYGFRGANVHVYALATGQARDRRFTMTTNWRSDRRLLGALNHVLDVPGAFGPSVSFGYIAVDPPDGQGADRLLPPDGDWTAPEAAPLQLRWFDGSLIGADPSAFVAKTKVGGALSARVAEDVVELLASGARIDARSGPRPVRPGDVAVLVRKGSQAQAVQAALGAVGVPAVLAGAASVLASDEALDLQHFLVALVEPFGGSAARVAASTRLFGWLAADLVAVEDEEPEAVARWDRWLAQLASWRELGNKRGFLAAFRRALDERGVIARLLALDDGERRVTNLLHVAELVHAAESEGRLHLAALATWFIQRRSDEDVDSDAAELRLDRDAEAVRVLTVHKAKGLEFPVCFVPWLWDGGMTDVAAHAPIVVPDPVARDRRVLDVAQPTDPAHRDLAVRETREEALRLAYVALTRAKHRCVVYAGFATDYELSPLAAILHGSGPDRLISGTDRVQRGPAGLDRDLDRLADTSVGEDGARRVSSRPCEPPVGLTWQADDVVVPELAVRRFERAALEPGWKRHSYTSLTRAAGPAFVEEGREGFDDDGDVQAVGLLAIDTQLMFEVPLAAFPAGADAGTLLHDIFEHADFADARPGGGAPEALFDLVADRLVQHAFDPVRWAELLADGLTRVLRTPLGAALGDLRLCDVPKRDRLDELRFDMPIRAAGSADLHAPARALVAALRARTDGALPASWLAGLDRLERVPLAGFLTGSIDLVFRASGDGSRARERWFVVDYKSNRLDPDRTGRCTPQAFDRDGMTAEMAHHDYFLQYHLYLVALHRYLRWRLPDYDYDRHVGGAYYLFFRGMVGEGTRRVGDHVHGCWFDRPPRSVVEALDAALGGGGT